MNIQRIVKGKLYANKADYTVFSKAEITQETLHTNNNRISMKIMEIVVLLLSHIVLRLPYVHSSVQRMYQLRCAYSTLLRHPETT